MCVSVCARRARARLARARARAARRRRARLRLRARARARARPRPARRARASAAAVAARARRAGARARAGARLRAAPRAPRRAARALPRRAAAPPRACTSPFGSDLGSQPDGQYDFNLKAADVAGNPASEYTGSYRLDTTPPSPPEATNEPVSPATDRTPSWAFRAKDGAVVECRLEHAGGLVADWTPCLSPQNYDLTGQSTGSFRLMLRATDLAGNTGSTRNVDYEMRAKEEPAAPAPDPPATPDPQPDPQPTPPLTPQPQPEKPVAHKVAPAVKKELPQPKPHKRASPFSDDGGALPQSAAPAPDVKHKSLGETLGSVVGAIAANPDKTVFPLSLIVLIVAS